MTSQPTSSRDIKGDQGHQNYGIVEEMEDRYLRLQEEHHLLKKHAFNQEDKLKKLTTKLTRLLNEKKKWFRDSKDLSTVRDVEMEELVQDLQDKVQDLERQNLLLKEKLLVTRQQVFSALKRKGPYQHVQSKVDSGRSKQSQIHRSIQISKVNGASGIEGIANTQGNGPGLPLYAVTLLEDAQNEIRKLEETIESQRAQLEIYEQEMESVNEQLKIKETEYEEELNTLRLKLTHGKKQQVQENLDLIKLNREVKEKSSKLAALEAQYGDLEEKMVCLRDAHSQLVENLEGQQKQLLEERKKNLTLQSQVNTSSFKHTEIEELQIMVEDLTKENEILKTANEQLISSAMDPERDLHIQFQEESLKQQISQLESLLNGELKEKETLLEHIKTEKERRGKMEEELKVLQQSNESKATRLAELEKRMQFFTQESEMDFGELEEALALVQQKKRSNQNELGFLLGANDNQQELTKQLKRAEAEHAETVSELEKTRNMLLLQYKLSRESQEELENLKKNFSKFQNEFELKTEKSTHVLALRETRIQKLERQLKDIADGTLQSWNGLQQLQDNSTGDICGPTSKFQKNIFEFSMHKVLLSEEGTKAFGNKIPSLFITWAFYNFDLQSSPVLKGDKLDFNCAARYEVDLNSHFLQYLCKDSVVIELHLSLGTNVSTVARTHLPLRELFDDPRGDHHRIYPLIGCRDGIKNLNYGTLHCNTLVPGNLEEAVILFQERLKAAGYLECNQRLTASALQALDKLQSKEPQKGLNELHIKIIRCKELQSTRKGSLPSPFCRYRFFNLTLQETIVIPASNNPEFNDHRILPVELSSQLDQYLKTQKLTIYVFDESELDKKNNLGKAMVSLSKLVSNSPVKGSYPLQSVERTPNGFIDVNIYWQFPYNPSQTPSLHMGEDIGVNKQSKGSTPIQPIAGTSGRSSVDTIRTDNGCDETDNDSVTSVSALNDDEIGSSLLDDDSDLLSTSTEEDQPQAEVVVAVTPSRKLPSPAKDERVVISVNSLRLVSDTAVLSDPTVSLLFVEYHFLDFPAEELETPFALPKPNPPQQIIFNFRKVFTIVGNAKVQSTRTKLLLDMLSPSGNRNSWLRFTVVSEPPEDENGRECEDIGYSFVDFNKILSARKDILDEDIEIFDSLEEETVIGYLNVRVEALAVLLSLKEKRKL